MEHELSLSEIKKKWHGNIKSYLIGFFSSAMLTVAAFFLVITRLFTGPTLIITIVTLGLIQAILQARFFLHVGEEEKPRWETLVFLFMVLVLLIIVLGSLWIMYDLNNRVMNGM